MVKIVWCWTKTIIENVIELDREDRSKSIHLCFQLISNKVGPYNSTYSRRKNENKTQRILLKKWENETIHTNSTFCLVLPTTDHLRNMWSSLSSKGKDTLFFSVLLSKCPVSPWFYFSFYTVIRKGGLDVYPGCIHAECQAHIYVISRRHLQWWG